MWKSQILVACKNFDRCQVGCTWMIDKPGDVSIIICINTERVSILESKNWFKIAIWILFFACNVINTLLSKSKRYESSRVSASESEISSPTYSQTKVPFGIGANGRTPQPIPKARNTWRRTEMPCWMTRLWQLETLHRHISLHSNIIGGSRKSKPSFKRPWRSYQDLTLKSEQLHVSSVEQLSEHLQCWKRFYF